MTLTEYRNDGVYVDGKFNAYWTWREGVDFDAAWDMTPEPWTEKVWNAAIDAAKEEFADFLTGSMEGDRRVQEILERLKA